jgi:transketolase
VYGRSEKGDAVMNDITQRDTFFDRLYEIAKADKDTVIVAADMSAPTLDRFRVDLPGQFVNVGIAEQNAIQIASGLSLAGKKAYAYAISPFITLRCLEQIRVSNAIMGIPITIVGMGTGLSYCNDGPTHHLLEDIAVMRALPNVRIANLTDNVMARAYADISYRSGTTYYLRLDKDVYPDVYAKDYDFTSGIGQVEEGGEYVVVASGPMVHSLLEAVRQIRKDSGVKGIGVLDVYDLPFKGEAFVRMVQGAKKILTVEEHFLPGGIGSAVLEVLSDYQLSIPVKRMGLNLADGYKYCYKYGGREIIREHYGIDKSSIIRSIKEFFNV